MALAPYTKDENTLPDGTKVTVTKFRDVDQAYKFVAQCNIPVSIVIGDYFDPYGNVWICDAVTAARLVKSGYSYCSHEHSLRVYETAEQFHTQKQIKKLPELIHREFVLLNGEIIKVQKFNNPHSCLGFTSANGFPVSIVLGNPGDPYGAFWICDPEDGFKLVEAGFEYFNADEFKRIFEAGKATHRRTSFGSDQEETAAQKTSPGTSRSFI